jgi:signal transduction histidine kinase
MTKAPAQAQAHPLEIYGDTRQITRIFYWFLGTILAALSLGALILLTAGDVVSAAFIGASLPPIAASLWLIRRGNFEWAAVFLALVLFGLITLTATRGLGAHHISTLGYPAILIVASLVTRKRTMVFLTLAAIACAAWLVFGELAGAYAPTVLLRSVPADFVSMSLVIVATASMVRLLSETLFENNQRLQRELLERRRAEERLEQDVALRQVAEAERERLIAELEARNTELERFTYTVSHDLKAPLITIRGFLGFVESDAQAGNAERLREDMGRIIEATDKMQRLLTELLELSRIGRMMNPPQAAPFEAIAREALAQVHGRLEAGGVQVELAANLPTVDGDRIRLVEVVQNLVDNAAKFMGPQPAPRIEIGQRGRDTDGKPILYVRDNGQGIEPQYHERVFGLFNKLDPLSEGTGVGLALVKRIVEVHGGRIWLESEGAGQGATFCFTLPAEPGPAAGAAG